MTAIIDTRPQQQISSLFNQSNQSIKAADSETTHEAKKSLPLSALSQKAASLVESSDKTVVLTPPQVAVNDADILSELDNIQAVMTHSQQGNLAPQSLLQAFSIGILSGSLAEPVNGSVSPQAAAVPQANGSVSPLAAAVPPVKQDIPVPITDIEQFSTLLADPDFSRKVAGALAAMGMTPQALKAESLTVQNAPDNIEKKGQSIDTVKANNLVGFQTEDLILVLMSLLSKIRESVDKGDRQLHSRFAELSANMSEKAAQSTINEGKQQMIGAVIGFTIGGLIAGAGTMTQLKGLSKQNKAINSDLKQVHTSNNKASELKQNMNMGAREVSGSKTTIQGKDNKALKVSEEINPAQKEFRTQEHQAAELKLQQQANAHQMSFDIKTHKAQKIEAAGQAVSRMSDNSNQMVTGVNGMAVKNIEAQKMTEDTAAGTLKNVAQDKEKQIDKTSDLLKTIRETLNGMQNDRNATIRAMIRG
ncbi:hypothetical protein NFB56_15290 [Yersinia ruckeri]|uniref:IpaC/SipC family type III secretion system effector n=1 Tax=Yersinia ruckeri TaxID=29486 RepID=UPI0011A2685C|nr:IpaC/SipC family type III secretion system effector [Yersinia ruckeri]EKN3347781.1 hypothetical protein [Yersinia ruckeri]EKN3363065.1 hypothetical protein [Yersinia ruckeri]EKN4202804.1 hypothetical protein [Yersinia ruckeri]EKN4705989.1 hypothetical protein [Yersinia ruckeri]EKN4727219.1 hypothetical protein [Yersinia ruckeri]